MPEDDDRSAAADSSWADVAVPDDLSELTADIAAYHREQRQRRRRVRVQRVVGHRRAFPLMVVTFALVVAAIVASLLTLLTGGTVDRSPTALPLAVTSVADGQLHGLLPDVQVIPIDAGTAGTPQTTRVRLLRPSVLAVIGPNCNCSALINALDGEAYQEALPLEVIVHASADSFASTLTSDNHRGTVNAFFDPNGDVAHAVGATGVTWVAVNRDGTIYGIGRSATTANIRTMGGTLGSMLLTTQTGG